MLLLDEIIQTPAIHQLHDQIELAVVLTGRENLDDVGVINRCRNARLLLQAGGVINLVTKILAQKLQSNETIQ